MRRKDKMGHSTCSALRFSGCLTRQDASLRICHVSSYGFEPRFCHCPKLSNGLYWPLLLRFPPAFWDKTTTNLVGQDTPHQSRSRVFCNLTGSCFQHCPARSPSPPCWVAGDGNGWMQKGKIKRFAEHGFHVFACQSIN